MAQNPASGYTSKIIESRESNRYYTPVFIAALFTIAKRWKHPKCPSMNEYIKKMWLYIQ